MHRCGAWISPRVVRPIGRDEPGRGTSSGTITPRVISTAAWRGDRMVRKLPRASIPRTSTIDEVIIRTGV